MLPICSQDGGEGLVLPISPPLPPRHFSLCCCCCCCCCLPPLSRCPESARSRDATQHVQAAGHAPSSPSGKSPLVTAKILRHSLENLGPFGQASQLRVAPGGRVAACVRRVAACVVVGTRRVHRTGMAAGSLQCCRVLTASQASLARAATGHGRGRGTRTHLPREEGS